VIVRRTKNGSSTRPRRRPQAAERLEEGQRIRDVRNQLEGVVLEYACQYAHPKADPVYSYLVQWDDGQINAISEAALQGDYGYETVD
jgi:hypothetical protein